MDNTFISNSNPSSTSSRGNRRLTPFLSHNISSISNNYTHNSSYSRRTTPRR